MAYFDTNKCKIVLEEDDRETFKECAKDNLNKKPKKRRDPFR